MSEVTTSLLDTLLASTTIEQATTLAPTRPLRVGVYARISADDKGDEKGVARQTEWGAAMAVEMGDSNPTIYVDNDISAHQTRKRRRDYERLLADIKAGRLDVLLATHPDRLYRRAADLERLIPLIESSGVSVRTKHAGEVELSTASGKMTARIVGAVAQAEVERGQERQRDKKAAMAKAGEVLGGPRPFGYKKGGYKVEPREAARIRTAARRILVGGQSVTDVAREWNRRGVKTARGNTWNGARVRNVLVRYRNVGIVEHQGKPVAAAQWSPVLDEETWSGLRAVLGDGTPTRRQKPRAETLLAGIARCGECGAVLWSAGEDPRGNQRYRCSASNHLKRLTRPIDDHVEAQVVAILSGPNAISLLGKGPSEDTVRELHTAAATRQAKIDEANAMFAEDEIDRAQLLDITTKARTKLAEIEKKLAALTAGSVLDGLAGRDDVVEIWDELDLDRKRAVIDHLVEVKVRRGATGGDRRSKARGERFISTIDVTPRENS